MSLVNSPGILLRSHPYGETSRILRFLTPGHGIVSVIGKGIRSQGTRGEAPIETFGEGVLTFYFRPDRDLHTLRDFQETRSSMALGRDVSRFVGAALIAELLVGHTLEEGDPELYSWVCIVFASLASIPKESVAGWILSGAWRTIAHLGFPPELDHCVRCGEDLVNPVRDGMNRFDVVAGGLCCKACSEATRMPRIGPSARMDLVGLVRGDPPQGLPGVSAHLSLLEEFCLHHLTSSNGFRSFAMLRPLLIVPRMES